MLQQEKAKDYVIATGQTYSVKEFVDKSCKYLGYDIEFEGSDINEVGRIKNINNPKVSDNNLKIGDIIIHVDSKYFRPTEVDVLIGDPLKAKELKWTPKTSLNDLVEEMIDSDLKNALKEKTLREKGLL